MRSTWHIPRAATPTRCTLLLVTLVVGCEHKSKKDDNPPPDKVMGSATGSSAPATGVAKPADDMKPEPVAKEPAKEAAAKPAGDDTVRPPTAEDLATYTQDITGNGPLTATIDTSMGTFHCELFADKSPMTVANFVGLATGKKAWQNPKSGQAETGKPSEKSVCGKTGFIL
jgi:peptidyl-prolyl cis-trans isomerase A (cyclophilin A)